MVFQAITQRDLIVVEKYHRAARRRRCRHQFPCRFNLCLGRSAFTKRQAPLMSDYQIDPDYPLESETWRHLLAKALGNRSFVCRYADHYGNPVDGDIVVCLDAV